MERALRYELGEILPNVRFFPTNAPKDFKPPYGIYFRDSTVWEKDLNGFVHSQAISWIINVMDADYENMLRMREKIEQFAKDMIKAHIGENDEVYIADVELNGVAEVFEHSLGLYRGIVDFTVFI